MNRWFGIGNLTDDPEMRYTPEGTPVTSFSIAINNGRNRDGEERPPTYIDIVAWDKLGENCAEYLRKGKKAAVEGEITIDRWNDKETGAPRKAYRIRARNVEFLSPREDGDAPRRSRDRDDDRPSRPRDDRPNRRAPRDDLDDLPF